jgi:peptidoglycan/LPS O-acetylase OafA/YrhL
VAATTAVPGHETSPPGRWQYQPALDGLRTLAVYAVVAFHGGLDLFGGGFIGVDLFFVLSGFLVTSVLLDGVEQHGRVRLFRFYARRIKRLLPAAGTCIVLTAAAFVLVAPPAARDNVLGGAQGAFLYVANWQFLAELTDYFAAEDDPSPFLHFWSLAIEEQFYLLFPALLVGAFALGRRWGRVPVVVTATLGGLMAASVLRQVTTAPGDERYAYYATDARLYQLLAGATLACALWWFPQVAARWPVPRAVGVAALAGLGVAVTSWWDLSPSNRGLLATVLAVALVGSLSVDRDGPLAWAYPPMLTLGSG